MQYVCMSGVLVQSGQKHYLCHWAGCGGGQLQLTELLWAKVVLQTVPRLLRMMSHVHPRIAASFKTNGLGQRSWPPCAHDCVIWGCNVKTRTQRSTNSGDKG